VSLTDQKKVSVIIRTKNEEKWITACLRSVYNQNYKNIEVIIVDNESTDKTLAKAQEFPVKVVSIKDFLPGKAINDGIRASSGEYVVCLSGHCVPVNHDWLGSLVQDLDKKNVAGVYGKQEPLSFTSDLDKRDLLIVFGKDKKVQVKDSFFHNANSAFRRDIWDKYPFDEQVTNIEDRVWGEQIVAQNLNIIYEPNASVYHWHGIHQDLSPERAKSIVKILEGMEGLKSEGVHQKPEDYN
jgi:glycosyltransferase involved in cell wall biosynthesis